MNTCHINANNKQFYLTSVVLRGNCQVHETLDKKAYTCKSEKKSTRHATLPWTSPPAPRRAGPVTALKVPCERWPGMARAVVCSNYERVQGGKIAPASLVLVER